MSQAPVSTTLVQKGIQAVNAFRFGLLSETEFQQLREHPDFIAAVKAQFEHAMPPCKSYSRFVGIYPDNWFLQQYYLRLVKPAAELTHQDLCYLDPKCDPDTFRALLQALQDSAKSALEHKDVL